MQALRRQLYSKPSCGFCGALSPSRAACAVGRAPLLFSGKHVIRELSEFLRQEGEERRGTLDMSKEQQADVQAFCDHVPNIDLKAEIVVDDEAEIVVGDIATCRITLTRKNLKVRMRSAASFDRRRCRKPCADFEDVAS